MDSSKNTKPEFIVHAPHVEGDGWKDVPEYHLELVRDRTMSFRKAFPNRYSAPLQDKAAVVLHEMLDKSPTEQFVVLLVNSDLQIIGAHRAAVGAMTHVEIQLASAFRAAIVAGAPSVILAHCHPTGTSRASDEDILMTMTAIEAGAVLGIEVIDHIVVSPDGSDYSIHDHQDRMSDIIRKRTRESMMDHPIQSLLSMFKNSLNDKNSGQPSLSGSVNPRQMKMDTIREILGIPGSKKPHGDGSGN